MKPKDIDPASVAAPIRVLIINPNTNPAVTKRVRIATLRFQRSGLVFDVEQPQSGPFSIETAQHRAQAQDEVLALIRTKDTSQYAAILTACFDDLALEEARRISHAPVYGTCELCIEIIRRITPKFSIVTTVQQAVQGIEQLVRLHGGGDAFTTYAAGIGVEQAAAAQPQTIDRVAATAASAIQLDGAKAILLASGGLTGYAPLLTGRVTVPIIDGVEAAIESIVERVGIKNLPL